jgi:hypothetical protein
MMYLYGTASLCELYDDSNNILGLTHRPESTSKTEEQRELFRMWADNPFGFTSEQISARSRPELSPQSQRERA